MTGTRAATLLELMHPIAYFTLSRAWNASTDDEFLWEPFPTTCGIRRRDRCTTPNPFGAGEWVADFAIPEPTSGWTSPYLTHHPICTTAADAVTALRDGWHQLRHAIAQADDDQLAATTAAYTYAPEPPKPASASGARRAPRTPPPTSSAGTLNEISHHATQIGAIRDFYA